MDKAYQLQYTVTVKKQHPLWSHEDEGKTYTVWAWCYGKKMLISYLARWNRNENWAYSLSAEDITNNENAKLLYPRPDIIVMD